MMRGSGQDHHIELTSSLLRQVLLKPFHVDLLINVNITDPWQ